jgi:serine/threonine protein kinase
MAIDSETASVVAVELERTPTPGALMSYCLNPVCAQPQNPDGAERCQCGTKLRLGDRYLALRAIGQGGFGRTFLAVDLLQEAKPLCVIKQFFPQALGTDSRDKAAELFQQEALRLKELGNHPQIPNLLDFVEQDGQQYLIQEFIDGRNLEQELAEQGAFSETQIRHLLNDLLPVLQFMHDRQVIHRDIKPANVIRRQSDQKLVLVDLGAAKYATGTALAKTGTVIGSAEFTAPEQTRGKATFASDIYSLGATCIHLLTQLSPFDLFDSSDDRWVWRDYLGQPVSEAIGRVLDKMLQSATKRRYQSAAEILQDLNPSVQENSAPRSVPSVHSTAQPTVKEQPIYTFTNAGSVVSIAPSLDGQMLVGSFASRQVSENAIRIWNLQTGELINTLPQTVWINAVAISPDGQTLVGGDANGTLKFWSLQTGELMGQIRAHAVQIVSVAISPDGQTLVTGSADSMIKLWNLNTGVRIRTLRQESRRVASLALSPDGELLVSSGFDATICLWHLRTGELLKTLKGNATSGYSSIALSPDRQIVACGDSVDRGTVEVWKGVDRHTYTHHTFAAHVGLVQVVALSPEGKLLATGSRDMTVKLWHLHTGDLVRAIEGHLSPIDSLVFSPDGKQVISGDGNGVIKVWSVQPEAQFRQRGIEGSENTDSRNQHFSRPNVLKSEFEPDTRSWRWDLRTDDASLPEPLVERDKPQSDSRNQHFSRPNVLKSEFEPDTRSWRWEIVEGYTRKVPIHPDLSFEQGRSIAPADAEDRSQPVVERTSRGIDKA